jgi:hypothetical protein
MYYTSLLIRKILNCTKYMILWFTHFTRIINIIRLIISNINISISLVRFDKVHINNIIVKLEINFYKYPSSPISY